MPDVRLAERRVWVGDQSRALLSGEVHFWRLDPSVWPEVLDRLSELGLDSVSSYVCWDFHEVAPGEFDFDGASNPRRNLLGFLDLAAERGFWVLLRPGPYIYAEWANSGIPQRCVAWHRLHPRFQDEAKVWMAAVIAAVRERLATHGGPIVLLQADNEADPWFDVYGAQVGLSESAGLSQAFLESRYVHTAELNATWNASYTTFAQARVVQTSGIEALEPRYLDFCRFRHWYATEVVRWTTEEYRRLGVDVPIYANSYADATVQDWRDLNTACDMAGPDIYPSAAVADAVDEHRRVLDSFRYARSAAPMAFSPEFESGIWHGWHHSVGVLTATHTELNAVTALLGGAHGWNWYMLAARDNWYMSPISEQGRFRPELSDAYAEMVRLFRLLDPPALEKTCETAVTINALERAAFPEAGQSVLRALYAADIDYEFFDLDSGRLQKPLVLYGGGTHVSDSQLARLRAYVEDGGTLVCFQPLDGLTELPVGVATAAAPQRLRVQLGETPVELSSASVLVYAADLGEPIVAERTRPLPPGQEGGHAHVQLPVGERLLVGYVAVHGSGRLVVLGLEPDPDLLVGLHAWLGVRIPSRSATPRIQSAVLQRDAQRFVIVTNTAADDRDVHLLLDLPARSGQDLRTGQPVPVTASGIVARVPARSGTAIRIL